MKSAVFSCVAGFAVAAPSPDVLAKFQEFRSKWGHTYVGIEYQRRAAYFEQTLHRIERLQRQELGTAIYSHLGPFSDLSPDEMAQRFGFFDSGATDEIPKARVPNLTLGSSFDWVEKGAVNPIKNQGQCGSCWSFSTACNLEGTGFVSTGKLVSLSEQYIMDCDKTCYSCNGGLPSLALTWSSKNGGVPSEASYPYKAHDESCRNAGLLTHNKGYTAISQNEDQIAQALVHYGPLSIGVYAPPWQSYSGGIFNNNCDGQLDHAVNIVGYGAGSGVQYWKIRNSWGTGWGESGYIRVERGNCECGLCKTVVTATGVTVSDSPSPTPPTPPTPPPSCENKVSWCPSTANWECQFLAPECQKSCGCCDSNPPSYCTAAKLSTPKSIFDEIKKLVCQYLANGTAEKEAEQLICSQFGSEVAICDEVVQILWVELESSCAPTTAAPAVKADPQSIFDDIKKLVCQYLANGTAESEAEKLICAQFGSEVAICDEVVKILWSELENQCAPSVVV